MSQPEEQQNQPQQPQSNDLASELRELGQQIEQAVRGALETDRAKQVQSDIAAGMREIGAQLQHTVKAIQESPQVQQLVQRGEQAVSQAQQSKAAQDFQESLARGVALLNEQLANFVTRLRQPDSDASTPPADASTGETTRLDPDQK
jgi:molecular chaperone GrpE (heat shock protein)